MKKVAFISCSKTKQDYKCKAGEMYLKSNLFTYGLRYCKKQQFDKIFILSAKYGVLELNDVIKPYELTLKDLSVEERNKWYAKVKKWIIDNIDKDTIIYFYVGKLYYKGLLYINHECKIPTKHLKIGQKIKFFKDNSNE